MKNQFKNEVNMGRAPGLHFLWKVMDSGTQLRAKLGGKSEPRQDKTGTKGFKKRMRKKNSS